MYDETPQTMGAYVLDEQGQKSGGVTTAKVMAANLGFSMTLEIMARPASSCQEEDPAKAAGADTPPLPVSEFHVIHGGLGSTLSNMLDATGPTTLHCIQRLMWMSPADQRRIEQLFSRCIILRMSDLHPSNLAAERYEATQRPRWASAFFRCCMHRIQTSEKVLLQGLEQRTESFFMNVALSLRKTPGSWTLFTKRARAWLQTVSASREDMSLDVRQWRSAMRELLFHDASHRLPSAKKMACFDELTRGDGRLSGRPLHHGCKWECCPSVAETARRFAVDVPAALLKTPPVLFPRKSWSGQAEAMNQIIFLEATNGLLSQCFRSVEAAAKVRSEKAVERLASKRGRDQHEPSTNDSQGAPEAVQGDADIHCKREKDLATQAAENAQTARDVLDFLSERGALRRMVRLRTLIEPYRKLKSSILGRSGKSWEQQHMASLIQVVPAEHQASSKATAVKGDNQNIASVKVESQNAASVKLERQNTREQSPLRQSVKVEHQTTTSVKSESQNTGEQSPSHHPLRYLVCCAALSHEVEEALRSLTKLVARPWDALKGLHGAPDGALRWCEVSIAGAALYQSVLHEQRQYPWKLFRLLEDDDAAFEIIADKEQCEHMLDPLARQHLTEYPDAAALQSVASKAELTSMAIVLEDNTSRIERGHSTVKRAASVAEQTHTAQITDVSAERLVSRARLLGESWHGKVVKAAADIMKSDRAPLARRVKGPAGRSHQPTRGAPKGRKKKKNKTNHGQGRKRAVTAKNAWMAVNAAGRFITSAHHQRCREAFQNKSEAEKYQQIATQMTRGQKTKQTPNISRR